MSRPLVFAATGLLMSLAIGCITTPPASGHPAGPPPSPVTPPQDVDPIPDEDEDLYHSRVVAIKPRVSGLSAEILGGDEKLRVTWTGEPPLTIIGAQGEPMVRLSARGVEVNAHSPSAFLSGDRYAQVPLPADVDPAAAPRWRVIDTPGSFSWYEHRAHWMDAERPPIVGDGTEAVTVFHWRVSTLLGERPVTIVGALDWVPDPGAIRAERSSVSSPVLSAAILVAAMALGAGAGVLVRRRLEGGFAA